MSVRIRDLLIVSLTGVAKFIGGLAGLVFILFCWLAGPAAGIWLIILGDWRLVVSGVFISLVMPHVYTLVCLPGLGLGMLTALAGEKGWVLITSMLGLLTAAFNYAIITVWVLFVFVYCIMWRGENVWIPYAVWAYAVTLSPLSYMASKEPPESTGTTLGLLFAMLAVVLLTILWRLGFSLKISVIGVGTVAATFSLCNCVLATTMARITRQQKKRSAWASETTKELLESLDSDACSSDSEDTVETWEEDENQLRTELAAEREMEYVNLDGMDIPSDVIEKVPSAMAKAYHIVPVEYDSQRNELIVALDDPENFKATDDLSTLTGFEVTAKIADPDALEKALTNYYEGNDDENDNELIDDTPGYLFLFKYTALDSQGIETRGEIEAKNQKQAVAKVRNMGYFPTNVSTRGPHIDISHNKNSDEDQGDFPETAGSEIIPSTSKVERAILDWEARISEKEDEASNLSLQIQDIKIAMNVFLGEYYSRVGVLYVKLDKLKLRIKEYEYRIAIAQGRELTRENLERIESEVNETFSQERRKVDDLENEVSDSAEEYDRHLKQEETQPLDEEFQQELKRIYRLLALRFHPDKAKDEVQARKFQKVFAAIADAYKKGDLETLKKYMKQAEREERIAKETPAEKLARLKNDYDRLLSIIAKLQAELDELKADETYKLKDKVEKAGEDGKDLLHKLAADIKEEIAENQVRLGGLVAEYKGLIGDVAY